MKVLALFTFIVIFSLPNFCLGGHIYTQHKGRVKSIKVCKTFKNRPDKKTCATTYYRKDKRPEKRIVTGSYYRTYVYIYDAHGQYAQKKVYDQNNELIKTVKIKQLTDRKGYEELTNGKYIYKTITLLDNANRMVKRIRYRSKDTISGVTDYTYNTDGSMKSATSALIFTYNERTSVTKIHKQYIYKDGRLIKIEGISKDMPRRSANGWTSTPWGQIRHRKKKPRKFLSVFSNHDSTGNPTRRVFTRNVSNITYTAHFEYYR